MIIAGTVVSVTVSDAEAVPDADLVAAQRHEKRSASRFHDMDISSGAIRTSTRRHQLAHYVRQRGRWPTWCSGDARTPFPAPAVEGGLRPTRFLVGQSMKFAAPLRINARGHGLSLEPLRRSPKNRCREITRLRWYF